MSSFWLTPYIILVLGILLFIIAIRGILRNHKRDMADINQRMKD